MPHVVASMARGEDDAGRYQRHRPEQTLRYHPTATEHPAWDQSTAQAISGTEW